MQLTHRIHALAAVGLAAALAAPQVAEAQVKVRDHRKKRPAKRVHVNSFAPQQGPVGTKVNIRGAGFTPRTRVIFGRTRVKPLRVTPTNLLVQVPEAYGDGSIVLRHPGVGGDIRVGQFAVDLPLTIAGFAPASGIPGTRVVIRGSGFRPGVVVQLGNVGVEVLRVTPTRLTVQVPEGAASAPFAVSAGQNVVRVNRPFRVLSPAPRLDALHPNGGAPGATVRVSGSNIGPRATVRYGRHPMQITKRGPGWIEAIIPPQATRSRYVWLRTSGGESRSPSKYRLEPVPIIKRFTPAYGIVGERVEIHGSNFRAGDRFSIDNRPMRVLQLRPRRVSAVIPRGARPGPIEVERGNYRAASPNDFEVLNPPVLLRMNPAYGEPGTKVTLVGQYLGPDTKVTYGRRPVRILSRSVGKAGNQRLVVRIPKEADDRRFRVITRGGEAATSQKFEVQYYPLAEKLSPRQGMVGTEILIRGSNLRHVQKVLLGQTELRIVQRKRGALVVQLSAAARTGNIQLMSYGERFDTKLRFEVMNAPQVLDMQPRAGVPGTEVVLSGRHFRRSTRVYLNGLELPILRLTPGRSITVVIPTKARSGQVTVGEGSARIPVRHPFVVLAAPRLRGFAPRKLMAGGQVTIRGNDFTRSTEVLWKGQPLPVVAREGSRTIVVNIPNYLEPGKGRLTLTQDGVTVATSRRPLKVLPAPPPPREKRPPPPPPPGKIKVRDHRKKKR